MGMGSVEWTDCRLVKEGGFRLIVVVMTMMVIVMMLTMLSSLVILYLSLEAGAGWLAGWLACRTILTQHEVACIITAS